MIKSPCDCASREETGGFLIPDVGVTFSSPKIIIVSVWRRRRRDTRGIFSHMDLDTRPSSPSSHPPPPPLPPVSSLIWMCLCFFIESFLVVLGPFIPFSASLAQMPLLSFLLMLPHEKRDKLPRNPLSHTDTRSSFNRHAEVVDPLSLSHSLFCCCNHTAAD